MPNREKTGVLIKGCSPKLTIHLSECLRNGMTKEELDKKYYWLKDIIHKVINKPFS